MAAALGLSEHDLKLRMMELGLGSAADQSN
jgi:hypothetical protein